MSDKSKKERAALLFQVHRILVKKTEAAAADRVKLRDAVCAFVFAEQHKGTSLRGMIQTIWEILEKAEKSASVTSPKHVAPPETRNLARQLVEWCVEFHGAGGPMIRSGPALLS